MRPQAEVYNIAYEPPADQARAGTRAGEGVRDQDPGSPAPRATDEPAHDADRRASAQRTRRAGASPIPSARQRADGEPRYWKSLDELAETPGFLEFLHREFPEQASVFEDPDGRREFLQVMGASLALAGLTGCTRQPTEKIVPYVASPRS